MLMDVPFTLLFFVDIFTGFIKAFRNRRFISYLGWWGAIRKAGALITLNVMQICHAPLFSTIGFCFVFACIECLSILENLRDASFSCSPLIARYIPPGTSERMLRDFIHSLFNGAEEPFVRFADRLQERYNATTTTDTTATVTTQTAAGPVEATAQVHTVTQPAQDSTASAQAVQQVSSR